MNFRLLPYIHQITFHDVTIHLAMLQKPKNNILRTVTISKCCCMHLRYHKCDSICKQSSHKLRKYYFLF